MLNMFEVTNEMIKWSKRLANFGTLCRLHQRAHSAWHRST